MENLVRIRIRKEHADSHCSFICFATTSKMKIVANFIIYIKGKLCVTVTRIAKGSNIWVGLQLFIWTSYKLQ